MSLSLDGNAFLAPIEDVKRVAVRYAHERHLDFLFRANLGRAREDDLPDINALQRPMRMKYDAHDVTRLPITSGDGMPNVNSSDFVRMWGLCRPLKQECSSKRTMIPASTSSPALRRMFQDNPRECRQFSHSRKSTWRDRTGWLGRRACRNNASSLKAA